MLYGISLLAGVLGSAHLPTMAARLAELLARAARRRDRLMVLALGGLMIMVGLAFKLSAVPFHFWCPDVFEGASAEVERVPVGRLEGRRPGAVGPRGDRLRLHAAAATASRRAADSRPACNVRRLSSSRRRCRQPTSRCARRRRSASRDATRSQRALRRSATSSCMLLAFMAVITCTFGNLAAYGQTNIKRLLAYSTIAHAGYMMMPVAAAVALAGNDPARPQRRDRRAGVLRRRLPVHEPGRVRHRRLPAQRDCTAKRSPTTPA